MKGEECYGLGLLRAAEFLQEEKKGFGGYQGAC